MGGGTGLRHVLSGTKSESWNTSHLRRTEIDKSVIRCQKRQKTQRFLSLFVTLLKIRVVSDPVPACEDLLDGLVKTIGAVWNHQSGSTGNHSVIFIKEMLLQVKL